MPPAAESGWGPTSGQTSCRDMARTISRSGRACCGVMCSWRSAWLQCAGCSRKRSLIGPISRLVNALAHPVARAGRPGEVVDVVAVIGHGLGVVRIIFVGHHSAGANHFVLRNGQLHVVDAEVGEEFGCVVILVAIPCAVPPDADFRKPLAAKNEIALPARARLGLCVAMVARKPKRTPTSAWSRSTAA